jgi:hypothetical protein
MGAAAKSVIVVEMSAMALKHCETPVGFDNVASGKTTALVS